MAFEIFQIAAEFMRQQHIVVEAPDPSPFTPMSAGAKPASQGQWYALAAVLDKPQWSVIAPGSPEFIVPILEFNLPGDWHRRTAAMIQFGWDLRAHMPDPSKADRIEKFWLWLYRHRDPNAPVYAAVALRVPNS